ncbi:Exodeoxyribonuclease V beta chain (EC [Olavius algarvensis associated proteobacterium Delta 3]|nr:Exodeoxyribonuclease V beta chain (EC [Olavius algarvensis associated proteobacterium Delta 3]CAB5112492.1 Exodeoxyribonuclease V beta chain (EC [Olavius algarvensis associated proteobacterium Delta 3]
MSYTLVDDTADIDLTRHALIEASAGTGKTYTLENLVIRLLKERQDIALENILMVTFTEKATSELKTRIQEKLIQEIRAPGDGVNDGETDKKIRDTLDAFDTASIYTIHGFCHNVLKEFAFENGSLFQNDVVDDGPVFDTLMKEQMRKAWPEVYGGHLPEMLHVSGFSTRKDQFLSLVVNIARRVFRPGVGDEIKPDTNGQSIGQIRAAVKTQVMALKPLIGAPPAFSGGFNQLNIHGSSKKSLMEKMVMPLETYLSQIDESSFAVADLLALIQQFQAVQSSGRQGIECLVPIKWLKAGNNIHVCPNLEDITERLTRLADVCLQLAYYLAIDAVKQLQTDAARVKRQNGWISYDDMLGQVASALHSDHSAGLIRTLRTKYKIAFVDEFQDTDPVQWRIFKRLFLDPSEGSSENLLVLIGDPKQAIYSFRGADVYAYLEARHAIERLSATGEAGLYSLATNWRSKPELVAAFNELFGRDEWFPPHDQAGSFEIGYQGAGSPGETDLPVVLDADRSNRPVLNVVDLHGPASPKHAKPVLARFVAREIRYLIDRGGIEIRDKTGASRSLDFGDVCILVRGRPDAFFLETELTDLDIPYSFYKKPGLFLSDEALYLSLVCHAVLDPGSVPDVKKALLTPFFAYKPTDLFALEHVPVSHPLRQLLFHWNDLARRRKWGMLFQSLMEDSGLLFRETGTHAWDRTYTNYRQIFEHLETVAYRKNLDFRGLSALLDSYRKQTAGAEDDADIHQIETEAQKVQIMTMHVSKGLEFPVVFIAGGLTQPFVDDYHVYHEYDPADPDAGIRKIIDLSKKYGKETHEREKNDEDKRLFYVALTRAQFKLYVPFLPASSKHAWMGPVCRFLSDAISSAFPRDNEKPEIGWQAPETHTVSGPVDETTVAQGSVSDRAIDTYHPLLPSNSNYQSRRIMLESFSSLQRRDSYRPGQQTQETGFQVVREKDREDDESFAAVDSDSIRSVRPDDDIPGGADIGSMFHDIFEHIDFETVPKNPDNLLDHPEIRGVIVNTMEDYRVDGHWLPQVCRIVANTLTTPVNVVEESFVLGRLKKEDRIHEVEFCYPFAFPAGEPLKIPDCDVVKGRRCFIRGFVDLVFRHDGKFFIADWKSNRLEGGYGRKSMDDCMDDAGYHMQYKLYTAAVLRWLKHTLGDRFDADRHFGGVFYFFLRGMGTGNGKGVYFVSPLEVGYLEDLEAEITGWMSGVANPNIP